MISLKFPSTSHWRPPGAHYLGILAFLAIHCITALPVNEEDKVISLPPHFKVDDPEPTGYDANFGRRLFNNEDETIAQQPSTLEEVVPSRVRKRILSSSVISERTIQVKDDNEEANNSLKVSPAEKVLGTSTTRGAVIKYVSTVPPAPFGARTTLLGKGGLVLSPTSHTPLDLEQERKATVRTVLRRPPSKAAVVDLKTTTLRSEVVRTPGNFSKQPVNIKDSLLARVQGRLRARSTTVAPITTKVTALPITTASERSSTTTATTTATTKTTSSTSEATTTETSSHFEEDLDETTFFKLPSPETTQDPDEDEEVVVTETSVSVSIGQSEAHKIVMTTLRSNSEDTTTNFEEDTAETTKVPKPPATTRTTEGILGSSLERPDGLQKELLAAIRRKITQKKENAKNETLLEEQEEDIEVSPNSVGSTQHPPYFRPIPFPNQERSLPTSPRVKIFLRVPSDEKPVKIPNYSHIQGKLARLNAAITEGLRNDQLKKLAEESINNVTTTTTIKPRLGAYTSTTSTTTPATTTTSVTTTTPATTTTTIPSTTTVSLILDIEEDEENPVIAEKTHTYLDILRKRVKYKDTTTPTTTSTTTTIITTTSTRKITTTTTVISKTATMYASSNKEHPTSHLRPKEVESTTTQKPPAHNDVEPKNILTSEEEQLESDSVIHDITGTTVYVVGVICIIPAAGLLAWIVRYVVKRRGMSSSENGSETGLNCPMSDEDMMQVNKLNTVVSSADMDNSNNKRKSVVMHDNLALVLDEPSLPGDDDHDKATAKEALVSSVWQISRQNLRFVAVLGEGNFGKVWKAEAENICGYEGTVLVAVKTTKEKAPDKEKTDLLQEMQIMQKIGHHPNVVTLLGVSIDKEPYLLVMEYVMYGKLLTHLREQRSKQTSLFHFTEDDLQQPSEDSTITSKDLTKYAYGVAKGMEYIESKQIIHRDLAARNILLDHNRCCKISDFGLSRNLGDTGSEMYEQKTKGALPIRWMAPESLYFSVFTPKSDVWSFGILMWEIVTLGSTPYPGMGAREVMKRVRDGYRLERPSHCHPDLYKIISKCWLGDMNKRPDFTELRLELAKLLEHQHGYIDLQNIPENKYYSMTQTSDEDEKL